MLRRHTGEQDLTAARFRLCTIGLCVRASGYRHTTTRQQRGEGSNGIRSVVAFPRRLMKCMEVGGIPGEACWSTCTSTTLPREADVGTSTGRVTRRGGGGERRRRKSELLTTAVRFTLQTLHTRGRAIQRQHSFDIRAQGTFEASGRRGVYLY